MWPGSPPRTSSPATTAPPRSTCPAGSRYATGCRGPGTAGSTTPCTMMALTQIRYPSTPGRVYYERKRKEGKTPKEALRCLKRRLSDVAYRQLVLDQRGTIEACGSPATLPPTPSTSASPASRSPQAAPPSRPAPRPPSTGSSPWTGKTTPRRHRDPRRQPPPAPRPPPGSRNHQLTAPQAGFPPGPAPDPRPIPLKPLRASGAVFPLASGSCAELTFTRTCRAADPGQAGACAYSLPEGSAEVSGVRAGPQGRRPQGDAKQP
jgi:hypothetical protein